MKDLRIWTLLASILILLGPVTAQKPKVQVTFQMAKDTEFYKKYKADSVRIKQEGLHIIIDGLNEYLPFIDFTPNNASNKLAIRLDKKNADSTGLIQETYFYLTFIDSLNKIVNVEWKFLSSGALVGLNKGASVVLPRIKQKWMDHLKVNYNNVLVHEMFKRIPINLHSKDYYLKLDDQYELVLPFKKQDINLSTTETDFMVVIKGKIQNFDKDVPQFPLRYSGDVVDGMGMIPALKGCIRIGLNQFTLNKIIGGQVFFLSYGRHTQDGLHDDL